MFTTIQELATRISHRNTGAITEDPPPRTLCSRVATDENLHYVFYRELVQSRARDRPPPCVAIKPQQGSVGFTMPRMDMPDFKAKAIEIAKAGIYDLRIHHDEVVLPVLFTHWKIDTLTALSQEAEEGGATASRTTSRCWRRRPAMMRRSARPGYGR